MGRMSPVRHLDQDVYTLALERIEIAADQADHLFVLFSGGKDSTAVLNLALEVLHSHPRHARHLPLRVVHQDEEAIPMETEEYVRRVSQRDDVNLEWLCLPLKHRNACSRKSPWWWPWAPEARDLWCRPLPPEAITELPGFPINPPSARLSAPDTNGLLAPPRLGNCIGLMGIRADESLVRRRVLTLEAGSREFNWMVRFTDGTARAGNFSKAYPIYDWTTPDVWTAPARGGWDYNRAYDRLEMAGVSHGMQRCSPAFGEEPLQKLHTYAKCFPDVWEKMVDRVPGVGAAARYALTELYAYRGRPEKPAGMPWPDFIRHYLTKYQPKDAQTIADRVGDEIQRHYRNAPRLPIMPQAKCPLTGISWDFLLMLAMRGDFKGRKNAGGAVNRNALDPRTIRQWHAYRDELQQHLDEGRWDELGAPGARPRRAEAVLPVDVKRLLNQTVLPVEAS